MAKKTAKANSPEGMAVDIEELKTQTAIFCIVGNSPLILNRMAEKAKRDLLFPTPVTKKPKGTLKHEPLIEYRDSVYRRLPDEDGPTRLLFPCPAMKGVMGTASLESEGVTKAGIGRLTWIDGFYLPIWGVPQLLMSVVRNAGINKTPDIRTRAIVGKWAAEMTITWVEPRVNHRAIGTLLHNGGLICGIGDWRQEKGSGNNGRYRLCNPDDEEFLAIKEAGGMAMQDAALGRPGFFDFDSGDLYEWFYSEVHRRGDNARLKDLAPLEVVVANRALKAGHVEGSVDERGYVGGISEAREARANNGNGSRPRGRKPKVN